MPPTEAWVSDASGAPPALEKRIVSGVGGRGAERLRAGRGRERALEHGAGGVVGAGIWVRAIKGIHLVDEPRAKRLFLATGRARGEERGEADAGRKNSYRSHASSACSRRECPRLIRQARACPRRV
jgi:hypothetical protein